MGQVSAESLGRFGGDISGGVPGLGGSGSDPDLARTTRLTGDH